MVRCYYKYVLSAAIMATTCVSSGWALELYWPKPDQIVRENVKISMPGSAVPQDSFISVAVGPEGNENFVLAMSSESVRSKNGDVTVIWNSKAPYRTISDSRTDRYVKDGKLAIKVEIHKQSDRSAEILDSATVPVVLKNKIARPNPAPAVNLAYKLGFGQLSAYHVTANAQVFEVVAGVGLPIVGGLGMSGDFKVIQSVEDVRTNGEFLMRYRIDEEPTVTMFGAKTHLYEDQAIKPQLYRLVDKYGNVIDRNLFSKQAKFSITDVLPVLPKKGVKEGDSWPDTFSLKLEGWTDLTQLNGSCMLDSFEWQDGHQCVKLVSQLSGSSVISLDNGRIHSSGVTVNAQVVSYVDYKLGKLIRREIMLDYPVIVEPGAGESPITASVGSSKTRSTGYASSPFGTENSTGSPYMATPVGGASSSQSGTSSAIKKGVLQINAIMLLEK